MLFTAMSGPEPSAKAAADPRTVRLALELLERTAGRRRRYRRCRNVIAENARKRGQAWSVCTACAQAIEDDARQLEIAPALLRRCLAGIIGRFVPRITVRRSPHSARLSGGLLRERLVTSPTVRDLVFHRLWRHCARRVTAPRRVCAYADVTGVQQRTGEHRTARHGLGNHFLHRRNSSRSTSRPIERQGGSTAQKKRVTEYPPH